MYWWIVLLAVTFYGCGLFHGMVLANWSHRNDRDF